MLALSDRISFHKIPRGKSQYRFSEAVVSMVMTKKKENKHPFLSFCPLQIWLQLFNGNHFVTFWRICCLSWEMYLQHFLAWCLMFVFFSCTKCLSTLEGPLTINDGCLWCWKVEFLRSDDRSSFNDDYHTLFLCSYCWVAPLHLCVSFNDQQGHRS